MSILIFTAVLTGFAVLAFTGYTSERRDWNGGVCRNCGTPWRYFDQCIMGDRGYTCGQHTTWISYPLIDRGQQ